MYPSEASTDTTSDETVTPSDSVIGVTSSEASTGTNGDETVTPSDSVNGVTSSQASAWGALPKAVRSHWRPVTSWNGLVLRDHYYKTVT